MGSEKDGDDGDDDDGILVMLMLLLLPLLLALGEGHWPWPWPKVLATLIALGDEHCNKNSRTEGNCCSQPVRNGNSP